MWASVYLRHVLLYQSRHNRELLRLVASWWSAVFRLIEENNTGFNWLNYLRFHAPLIEFTAKGTLTVTNKFCRCNRLTNTIWSGNGVHAIIFNTNVFNDQSVDEWTKLIFIPKFERKIFQSTTERNECFKSSIKRENKQKKFQFEFRFIFKHFQMHFKLYRQVNPLKSNEKFQKLKE